MKAITSIGLLIGSLMLSNAPIVAPEASAQQQPAKSSDQFSRQELMDHFRQLAFKAEFGTPPAPRILRWAEEVNFGIMGNEHRYRYVSVFDNYVESLMVHSGRKIDLKLVGVANFILFPTLFSEAEAKKYAPGLKAFFPNKHEQEVIAYFAEKARDKEPCYLKNTTGGRGIAGAVMFYRASITPETAMACSLKLATRGLGFFGNTSNPSSAFNLPNPTEFSAIDRASLVLMFNERLRPGMDWDEASKIVEQIIAENKL
jgi:hypothetical protein